MIIIEFNIGFGLKKRTLLGSGDEKYRLWVLVLFIFRITWLNSAARGHLISSMRGAFSDPQWLIDNYPSIRLARRKAESGKHRAWFKGLAKAREEYQSRVDDLQKQVHELSKECRGYVRDIEAYQRLVNPNNKLE